MSALPRATAVGTAFDAISIARDVLRRESAAIASLADRLGGDFLEAVATIEDCQGSVVVTGVGKAGLIGRKLVATFNSTGTRSHFLHAAEAMHGDLGSVRGGDVAVVLSNSGQTSEILKLLPSLQSLAAASIAITGNPKSELARRVDVALDLGPVPEACPHGLAPTTSTAAMLALGDALALAVSGRRGFTASDFARYHPGGSLGRKLARVEDAMRPLAQCRLASEEETVRAALVATASSGRRTGAVMVTGAGGKLTGVFTDSDLARRLEERRDDIFDRPLREVMTPSPVAIAAGASLREAVALLAERKISELPAIDGDSRPIGIIDITDVVGLFPPSAGESPIAGRVPLNS